MSLYRLIGLLGACGAVYAQTHEFGVLGGGGFGTTASIAGAPSVAAGPSSGVAGGVLLGQDLYAHFSGEIRYLFEQTSLRVSSPSAEASLAGQSHVFSYDLIIHPRPRKGHAQPYLAVGGGMKLIRGTGSEQAYRPLMQYAYLTQGQQWRPMIAAGGGVKLPVGRRLTLRMEMQDQITPFPNKLIAPAPGFGTKGWLHDFVPAVGFSWQF